MLNHEPTQYKDNMHVYQVPFDFLLLFFVQEK